MVLPAQSSRGVPLVLFTHSFHKEFAMAAKTSKAKKMPVPVLKNLDEVSEYIGKIGNLVRQVKHIENQRDQEIADLEAEVAADVAPLVAEFHQAFAAVDLYAKTNKRELLAGSDAKTARFPAGSIKWRLEPLATKIKGVKTVIEEIKKLKLGKKFLRTRVTINKEAMLDNKELAETIPGVSIVGGVTDIMTVTPNEHGAEITKDSLKKKVKKKADSDDEAE